MTTIVERAENYLAENAAESGADVLIRELIDEIERLRGALKAARYEASRATYSMD